ncbi:DNA mismatch repair protein MutS [Roseivivax halodurans JCM 10272]|uniref:DNA mismatch repair protein MutS n=1 Tax=Roseivivax halodurans JCM 10272 TaxID=1449350 RepID=X7EIJ7_9RHOB|nr:Smr/MutS family protein [Roseivivax halodurans]ETX15914.1 DNA mismatch repair protein MutS [Roseivivax halodurans JCM 10272]
MKGRKPRHEELELWSQVARTAKKLPGQRRDPAPEAKPGPKRKKAHDPPVRPQLPAFEVGERARGRSSVSLPQSTSERLAQEAVDMDAKAHKRLKRGKLAPEARLDLHGMTLDEAHPALVGFMYSAQAKGLRLVLIITGKGQREDPYDPMPRRRGVLKTQVPHWLRMAPLGPMVLQISEAHIRHGGGGAYYVYLRRRR